MHLWEFLLELLAQENCHSVISWVCKERSEFRIENPQELAKKWGAFKNKRTTNYENLSRSLRFYYNQGILKKVPKKRLVYKFHKLPYSYEPGVTRSRNHGQRIDACIQTKQPCVTGSRYGHRSRIVKYTEQHEPRLMVSRQNGDWSSACIVQEEQRQTHPTPTQTNIKSAFAPITAPVRKTWPLPLIPIQLHRTVSYPDPTPLALPLSNTSSTVVSPVVVDSMAHDSEPVFPVKPVEPVTPVGHVETTAASSIRVSVIRRI